MTDAAGPTRESLRRGPFDVLGRLTSKQSIREVSVRSFMASRCLAIVFSAVSLGAFAADTTVQQSPDQWRASKLVGLQVYGPDNQSVGKISDVLMSKDGKAASVIIGVGGFLGLGEKDVSVPYEQVKFTEQPMLPPANPDPTRIAGATAPNNTMASAIATKVPNKTVGGMAADGGVAPATTVGLGTPGDAPAGTGDIAVMHSTAYPDHGTIDMTVDQLKAAPTFQFAK